MSKPPGAFASAVAMTGNMWKKDGPERFAHEVRSALQGFFPYAEMLHEAQSSSLPEGQYEKAARLALAGSVNPFVQLARVTRTPGDYVRLMTSFMHYAPLAFRTFVDLNGHTRRIRVGEHTYPDIKGNHELTVHLLKTAQDWITAKGRASTQRMMEMRELARFLNVDQGVIGEAIECIEQHPALRPAELASALNLTPHQLARFMRPMGVRPSELRELAMLQAAVKLMIGPATLTEIAHHVGYADAAHLSRSFVRATGVAPSLMRPLPMSAPSR